MLACVDSDAENIFITLTARELRDDVLIVARASVEDSEKKLRRAGADRVISPYKTAGSEMARLALHPFVTGVVDVAPEYRMEEIEVGTGSGGENSAIADIARRGHRRRAAPARRPRRRPAADRHDAARGRHHLRARHARAPSTASSSCSRPRAFAPT